MLTKLTIRNFKRFSEVEIELDNPVVFVGPNNSGKTSAMQALALWDIGVKRWKEKLNGKNKNKPGRRYGVTVNRKDLLAIPHPNTNLLWRNLRVREGSEVNGKQRTDNVHIEIIVEGNSDNDSDSWICGMEFYYANAESFYCRPLRLEDEESSRQMSILSQAGSEQIALLPPMSGLAATETRLDPGAVNVRVGEGRTAEVLRNLCYRIMTDHPTRWAGLIETIKTLFGVEINEPMYVEERGEISMDYKERSGAILDLSSSGRGLQQTLLIFAYMAANPGAVILLDEPDAHLEILRQRNIYQRLNEAARVNSNQIIAATHSEVLLNEAAANKDAVIAFVGKPHRIGERGDQVLKALAEIDFNQYYLAESKGWVLYLEGPTDLAILKAFAKRIGNEKAFNVLENPLVHYVQNLQKKAETHFFGLKEAVPYLKGIALFDRLEQKLKDNPALKCTAWQRREIENYLCSEKTLEKYAYDTAARKFRADPGGLQKDTPDSQEELFNLSKELFEPQADRQLKAMQLAIHEFRQALEIQRKGSPWDHNIKASEEVLKPLFSNYFRSIGLRNTMGKRNFYELVDYIPEDEIDSEVIEKLDEIVRVAKSAKRPEDH